MGPNELLFWLSARLEGSWAQFRSAVEEVIGDASLTSKKTQDAIPVHQQQRFNLQSLAHVEFDSAGCEDGWCVTPPVLALCRHPVNGFIGVLCGARLPASLRRLEEAAKAGLERHTLTEQPDVLRISGTSKESLLAAATSAGLNVQEDAPAAILGCLPQADGLGNGVTVALPFGKDWEVSRFNIGRKSSAWAKISVAEAGRMRDGLLQFKRFQIPQYFLVISGRGYRVPGPVGKFFLLAKLAKRVMRYDRHAHSVVMPGTFRPPVLVDRALVLCSGFLPQFDNGRRTLTYRDVPEDIAGLAADILRQPGL